MEFDLTAFFYGAMVLMEIKKETVDAEITLVMLIQRVRVAENRAENKPSNGPLRAQSKALLSILRRKAYVTCWGYDGIS